MNIINKIKKIFVSIAITIGTLITNTFAALPFIPTATFYGVQEPPVSSVLAMIGKFVVIPVILIVGVIVFFKKKKKKD